MMKKRTGRAAINELSVIFFKVEINPRVIYFCDLMVNCELEHVKVKKEIFFTHT